MTIDFTQFAKEAHELAVAKGWFEERDLKDPDVELSMKALIHSEISEALECIRRGQILGAFELGTKPVGLGSELADVVIRIMDFSQAFSLHMHVDIQMSDFIPNPHITPNQAGASIHQMHDSVSLDAYEGVIEECYYLACCYDIDLDSCILLKHEFNKTRSHRHGGKTL